MSSADRWVDPILKNKLYFFTSDYPELETAGSKYQVSGWPQHIQQRPEFHQHVQQAVLGYGQPHPDQLLLALHHPEEDRFDSCFHRVLCRLQSQSNRQL